MKVYAAFRSVPDYTSRSGPTLVSLHHSLHKATEALYPDRPEYQNFRRDSEDTWTGPDGFGLVRLMEVKP